MKFLGKFLSFSSLQIFSKNSFSKLNFSPLKTNASNFPLFSFTKRFSSQSIPQSIPPKIVHRWLFLNAGLVFGVVILGGVTRLTESGLSMTKWHPFKGIIPPLNEKAWEEEFQHYQQFPEFKVLNHSITLSEFKKIFYMEYAHRMAARLLGLVFVLPGLYFYKVGHLPGKSLKVKLSLIGLMIGLQGLLGWFMVRSGMDENLLSQQENNIPRVSQYRLAAHLGSAFLIYTFMILLGLNLRKNHLKISTSATQEMIQNLVPKQKKMFLSSVFLSKFVFFTAISGALVAGLDAGLVYNSFPKMADRWIPQDIFSISPLWKNFLENPTTVQFDHRILGLSTVALITAFWFYSKRLSLPKSARIALNTTLGVCYLQATLGISTLLYFVPVHLAASHQAGSLTLLTCILWLAHELKKLPKI